MVAPYYLTRFKIVTRWFNIKYRFFFTNGFKYRQTHVASFAYSNWLQKLFPFVLVFLSWLMLIALIYIN